jgi:hypothetical protein
MALPAALCHMPLDEVIPFGRRITLAVDHTFLTALKAWCLARDSDGVTAKGASDTNIRRMATGGNLWSLAFEPLAVCPLSLVTMVIISRASHGGHEGPPSELGAMWRMQCGGREDVWAGLVCERIATSTVYLFGAQRCARGLGRSPEDD